MPTGAVNFIATEVSAVFSLAGLGLSVGGDNALAIASRSPGPVYLNFATVPGGVYPSPAGPAFPGVQQFAAGSLVARPDLPGCILVPPGAVLILTGADLNRLGAANMVAAWAPMRAMVRLASTNVAPSNSDMLDI